MKDIILDGIRMKILRDRIIPEGYQSRLRCAKWVWELIGKGILKREE